MTLSRAVHEPAEAAPVAALAIATAIPAALLLANAIAALPARRAARLRPAEVLRAE